MARSQGDIPMEIDSSDHPPPPVPSQADSAGTECTSKKKHKSTRSIYWEEFDKFVSKDGTQMARCKLCKAEVRADPIKNGTTGLQSHSRSCKVKIKVPDPSQSILGFRLTPGEDVDPNSMAILRCDPETIRKGLTQMIIGCELPFNIVSKPPFIRFMSLVCPKFHIPSRWTVQRDTYNLFLDEKENMKEIFKKTKQRICFTTDTWTSIQEANYMCLTAHFIDDCWVLRKRLLAFCPISSHKGKDIGMEIDRCLREWGLESIFTITVDNASSNDVALKHLKERYCNKAVSVMKCQLLHMRCVAHIINLIVKDGLSMLSTSVCKVRLAVSHVRGSPQRLAKFRECKLAEKVESKCNVILDCQTRWNSTYLMLEIALQHEKAFARYDDENENFTREVRKGDECMVPTAADWGNIRRLLPFLKNFYDLTLRVSGSNFVTSNTFFHEIVTLDEALREWQDHEDPEMALMAINMKAKYDKYWGDPEKMNMLLFVAVIFDPRVKLDYVEMCLSDMYGEKANVMFNKVKETLYALFDDYRKKWIVENGDVDGNDGDGDSDNVAKPSNLAKSELKMLERLERLNRKRKDFRSLDGKSELDRYIDEDRETLKGNTKFDILAYWKNNAFRLPILAQMARDVLTMPISTVASESTFSTGGRVLDAYRSSLGYKTVESLLCTQDWIGAWNIEDAEEEQRELIAQINFDESLPLEKLSLNDVGSSSRLA